MTQYDLPDGLPARQVLVTELLEPGCKERSNAFGLFVCSEMAGIGQQVKVASAGCGTEGFHLGARDGQVFSAGESEDGNSDCADGGDGVWARRETGLHGDDSFRRKRHAGTQFGDDCGAARAGRCSDGGLGHAVEERLSFAGACFGDGFGALDTIGFRVGLGLGTDEGETAHALVRLTPELKQDVAADGAADEHGFVQSEAIEKSEGVRGKLGHGERGRVNPADEGLSAGSPCVGNEGEFSEGKIGAQFGGSVGAEIGNNGAEVGKLLGQTLDEWKPVDMVDRRGVEEDDWQAGAGLDVGEAGSDGDIGFGLHRNHLR
jgi:hypothetical protein